MLNFFAAGPDLVRWDLISEGPDGPYRLSIHHALGVIVEYFDSVAGALLRQGELEELLIASRAVAPSESDPSWVDVDDDKVKPRGSDKGRTPARPRRRAAQG